MTKTATVLILVTAVCCGISQAYTITEQFKPDSPLVKQTDPNSGSAFSYSPEGYGSFGLQRKSIGGSVAQYYRPLDQKYFMPGTGNAFTTNDIWFGFDYYYSPSSSGVGAGHIGIFDSNATNMNETPAKLNSIAVMPYKSDSNELRIRVETNASDGTISRSDTQVLFTGIIPGNSYRVRLHLYASGTATKVDADLYSVDAGNAVSLITSNNNLTIISGTTFQAGMNALGVRNNSGTDSNSTSKFLVDNLYFSTTQAQSDATLGAPGWLTHDDPANPALVVDNVIVNEDFRPKPASWKHVGGVNSGSNISDDPNRFVNIKPIRRKNAVDSVAAYYKSQFIGSSLGSRLYMPFDYAGMQFSSTNQFWFGFDYKYISGSTGFMWSAGVFNSDGTNNTAGYTKQNCIALEIGGTALNMRTIGNTNWSTEWQSEPSMGTLPIQTGTYRFVVRIYRDVDVTKADLTAYQFDSVTGVLNPTPVLTTTGVALTDATKKAFFEGMDAFGIRNNSVGQGSSTTSSTFLYFDNAWFSTEAPNTTMPKPSWFCANGADFNCDGHIDMADMRQIANDWLSTTQIDSDMDDSGQVNFLDLARFASYFMKY